MPTVLLREALPVVLLVQISLLPGNTVMREQAEAMLQSVMATQVPQVISQDKHGQEQSYDQGHDEEEQAQEKPDYSFLSAS